MIIPFGIIAGILLAAHILVYKTIISIFVFTNPTHILILRVLCIVLSFSFIVASLIETKYESIFSKIFYNVSALWTGFLLYIFIAGGTYWVTRYILSYTNISTSHVALGKLLLAGAVILSIYGIVHARAITTTTIEISLPNTPIEWIGKKAVWISDAHLGQIYGVSYAQKIVEIIQEIHPDIIFIGGDLFDGSTQFPQQKIQPFSQLHAPWGMYFITGNHEEFSDPLVYIEAAKAVGMRPLMNELLHIHGMQLIGVDYRDTTQADQFLNILKEMNISKNTPSILLKHVPFDLGVANQEGISLQISGHTHVGQTFPINLITRLVYKGFDYGLHTFGNMGIYTSSGVGTWGPPLRVGTSAEIVVIKFK